ncbi:transposase [Streptomyces bottropensis ATCC 25435]|uniref:Transposase n=1 Tax=Streptomyces bottropensis ATCC 25435 TaxID=1054862 RepID=M3EZX0_9ACTN|nr:transposase [Streptomyces bottropensis ATCC 25435]
MVTLESARQGSPWRAGSLQVNCAFSFCWAQWFTPPGPLDVTAPDPCPDEEQR